MAAIRIVFLILFLAFSAFAFINSGQIAKPEQPDFRIDTIAENLRVPWQIVFLPGSGDILFTEREGRVRIIREGRLVPKPLLNLNDVVLRNKSGALGLCLHPDFVNNKLVYLASNYLLNNQMKLKIVRYKMGKDTLAEPFILIKDIPANQNHTGCRLVFGPDKKLYITTGDADQPMLAQDLKAYNGKILRVNDDGTIPPDNPFAKNDTARGEIWSYGHRNPQGIAFQPGTGLLFESEHGPTGGDEINIIKKGSNYGWPVIHHDESRTGMESPLIQYTPSVAPGEILFYSGQRYPALRGRLLVACLRGEAILNLEVANKKISGQLTMLKNKYGRIRSLVTGPDGYIYFSTSMYDPAEGHPRDKHDDMILRIRSAGNQVAGVQQVKKQVKSRPSQARNRTNATALIYKQLCASCHGDHLQGTATAKSLARGKFLHGGDRRSIIRNITFGITEKGMPAWNGAISTADIEKLTDYIIRYRSSN